MSFFRVLLALLISGGIAYSLYVAVGGKGFDRVVEAVRTEIVDPVRERIAPEGATDESTEAVVEVEVEVEVEPEAEPVSTTVDAEPVVVEEDGEAESVPVDEGTNTVDAETIVAIEDDAPVDDTIIGEGIAPANPVPDDTAMTDGEESVVVEGAEGETRSFVERTEETLANAAQAVGTAAEEVVEAVTGSGDDTAEPVSDNTVPRISALPAPSETVLPAEGQAPAALEAQNALPTTRIEESDAVDTDSTDALEVVVGGMSYVEARETMIAAGWTPRVPEIRAVGPSEAETALIEAGYEELEGCKDGDRPLCRFEFVDGAKRIAAVLTAGTGTDPSVIDAFLMDIRAE